jgi:hypothetical protein
MEDAGVRQTRQQKSGWALRVNHFEVMSAERMVPAERFDILKDQNVRSFSL